MTTTMTNLLPTMTINHVADVERCGYNLQFVFDERKLGEGYDPAALVAVYDRREWCDNRAAMDAKYPLGDYWSCCGELIGDTAYLYLS